MKRLTTILAALLLTVTQLFSAKFEPVSDDWGAVRNFLYSRSSALNPGEPRRALQETPAWGRIKIACSWSDITKYITDIHDKVIEKSNQYFKKQTNQPKAAGWDVYKWHLAGIMGWIVIAYLLWIAMAYFINGWLELIFFLWGFVPPYWYVMSNPHSLWFSDPACVGWTWAFFGFVFFVILMAWFWTSVKRYCISWNGANWFTSLLGIIYGWGCLYLIVRIFLATMNQELVLLTITMVFTAFGKVPSPNIAQDGTLQDEHGNTIHGHFEAGKFYGKNGGIYEPDPASATGGWQRVN